VHEHRPVTDAKIVWMIVHDLGGRDHHPIVLDRPAVARQRSLILRLHQLADQDARKFPISRANTRRSAKPTKAAHARPNIRKPRCAMISTTVAASIATSTSSG
jgi:hypothetical protein